MDFEIGTIAVGLAGVAKQFGVSGKWLILTAVLSGMAVSLLQNLVPDASRYVFDALVTGLATAGLYGVGKGIGQAFLNGRNGG